MTKASKQRRKAARKEMHAAARTQPRTVPAPAPTQPSGPRPHAPKGTRVAIIREEHGWHDGQTTGVLIDDHGTVRSDDGITYECAKRRDYYVID